jgi:hypothetical protein
MTLHCRPFADPDGPACCPPEGTHPHPAKTGHFRTCPPHPAARTPGDLFLRLPTPAKKRRRRPANPSPGGQKRPFPAIRRRGVPQRLALCPLPESRPKRSRPVPAIGNRPYGRPSGRKSPNRQSCHARPRNPPPGQNRPIPATSRRVAAGWPELSGIAAGKTCRGGAGRTVRSDPPCPGALRDEARRRARAAPALW